MTDPAGPAVADAEDDLAAAMTAAHSMLAYLDGLPGMKALGGPAAVILGVALRKGPDGGVDDFASVVEATKQAAARYARPRPHTGVLAWTDGLMPLATRTAALWYAAWITAEAPSLAEPVAALLDALWPSRPTDADRGQVVAAAVRVRRATAECALQPVPEALRLLGVYSNDSDQPRPDRVHVRLCRAAGGAALAHDRGVGLGIALRLLIDPGHGRAAGLMASLTPALEDHR